MQDHEKEFLTRRETCEYLGISLATLDKYVKDYDDFPIVKFSPRKVKIMKKRLVEWVEARADST